MKTLHFDALRQEYLKGGIDEKELTDSPFDFFAKWINEAINAGVVEPNAMVLSTLGEQAAPSSRIVLLKEVINNTFIFYTNYNSRKAKDILWNPKVSLLFFWKEVERQIRIEGEVKKISKEKSDAYFNSRPFESKISAIVSAQSSIIPNRLYIEKMWDKYYADNINTKIERPNYWGGYAVCPTYFEFWQGEKNRLHDRFIYAYKNNVWKIERLSP